ncbi:MAG: VOC family protein [Patulibacter sp.]|nr:VOC family protein [Patulibacter sp.]
MADSPSPNDTAPPEGWFRDTPDSSSLPAPRVLVPVLLDPQDLVPAIEFYETMQDVRCDMRLPLPDIGLDVAVVGGFSLIAGTTEARKPASGLRAIVTVADADEAHERLVAAGVEILQPPFAAPVGRLMYARHADGTVAEYIEHRPRPGEAGRPA